jgi:hypothetical protein
VYAGGILPLPPHCHTCAHVPAVGLILQTAHPFSHSPTKATSVITIRYPNAIVRNQLAKRQNYCLMKQQLRCNNRSALWEQNSEVQTSLMPNLTLQNNIKTVISTCLTKICSPKIHFNIILQPQPLCSVRPICNSFSIIFH